MGFYYASLFGKTRVRFASLPCVERRCRSCKDLTQHGQWNVMVLGFDMFWYFYVFFVCGMFNVCLFFGMIFDGRPFPSDPEAFGFPEDA